MQKTKGLLLLVASVGLIMVAIVFTALLDQSSNGNKDVRARASKTTSMELTGAVLKYDDTKRVLLVDGIQFADTNGKQLGTWEVTPPETFNLANFPPGTKVHVYAIPSTFQVATKTLTAAEITK